MENQTWKTKKYHRNTIKCFEKTHHEAMAVLPFDEAFFDWAYEAYHNIGTGG